MKLWGRVSTAWRISQPGGPRPVHDRAAAGRHGLLARREPPARVVPRQADIPMRMRPALAGETGCISSPWMAFESRKRSSPARGSALPQQGAEHGVEALPSVFRRTQAVTVENQKTAVNEAGERQRIEHIFGLAAGFAREAGARHRLGGTARPPRP